MAKKAKAWAETLEAEYKECFDRLADELSAHITLEKVPSDHLTVTSANPGPDPGDYLYIPMELDDGEDG